MRKKQKLFMIMAAVVALAVFTGGSGLCAANSEMLQFSAGGHILGFEKTVSVRPPVPMP